MHYASLWFAISHHPSILPILLFQFQLISALSITLSFPMLFTQKLIQMDGYCGKFCFEQWGSDERLREAYGTLLLVVQFVVPLTIITFCYTAISVRLNQVDLQIGMV